MQALEDLEDLLGKLRIKANTVVADPDAEIGAVVPAEAQAFECRVVHLFAADPDIDRAACSGKLQGVGNKVVKQLVHLKGYGLHYG